MGEGVVTSTPHIVLSQGIGSCVVVTLYDPRKKLGGIAHIMLPESNKLNGQRPPYHCVDTAIATLLRKLRSMEASQPNMEAKIIGGAQMFLCSNGSGPGIGQQNISSTERILNQEGIPLRGKDIGGNCGRNVEFFLDSGKVIVKTAGKKEDIEL
jgi:chemotaxis protein CheD